MVVLDKYPQWFRMRKVESGAHTFTSQAFNTPVIRGPTNYYIMEVSKVYTELLLGDGAQLVTAKETGSSFTITLIEYASMPAPDEDGVFFYQSIKFHTLTSGAGSYTNHIFDITDGQGNGVLLADREIFLNVQGDADMAGPIIVNVWLLYNMVKVSANELLDMLEQYD